MRMPPGVLAALCCPLCQGALTGRGESLACPAGHAFDVAREGYVSLLTGRAPASGGDSADMVRARQEFLEAGHFAPLADRLAALVADVPEPGLVADVGAGTGYYLARVLDAVPGALGLALDVSRYALRRAAKCHDRAGAAGCDAWRGLPLRAGSAGVLVNVFAPRNGPEFRRVLRPDGLLVVVTPTEGHLGELRAALGLVEVDPRKEERLERSLGPDFDLVGDERLDAPLRLSHADVRTVVGMGPSARHVTAGELDRRVAALAEPAQVTAAFRVTVHRPRPRA
ncbi:putative RNA methyltransferase [Marinitenerispora sediminis]|uniref:putative RNA methyltransferase n=1 Tax=Marinitenerispora sediminis TaxID=1931232 RepID=UPI002161267E|nr:methyltransferase type 11 [Marinitenerispora sediminis]